MEQEKITKKEIEDIEREIQEQPVRVRCAVNPQHEYGRVLVVETIK